MKKVNFIKTVCAWCEIDIGIKPSVIGLSGGISHGICVDCFNAAVNTLAQEEDSWQVFKGGPGGCRSKLDSGSVACRQ